jgi:hypothetical protein
MRANMKNLTAYIDQKNTWGGFFGTAPTSFPLTQKDVDELASALDCDLSPENLHCDGEISVAQANRKYNEYGRVIAQLNKYCAQNGLTMPTIYEFG